MTTVAALALLLLTGGALAERAVILDEVTASFEDNEGAPQLIASKLHEIRLRLRNTGPPPGESADLNYNISNGFRIFSDDGADWSYPVRDTYIEVIIPGLLEETFVDSILWADPKFKGWFGSVFSRTYFSPDGSGSDTLAYMGASGNISLRPGTDEVVWIIPIQSRLQDTGKHICIDSCWFPPGGAWTWEPLQVEGGPTIAPLWSGQKCFGISTHCCIGEYTSNVDYDPEDIVDMGDLTALIAYLYIPPNPEPPCLPEANIDGDSVGLVDIGDLTALISYLYIPPNPTPAHCP
jgi:hypothetical protein